MPIKSVANQNNSSNFSELCGYAASVLEDFAGSRLTGGVLQAASAYALVPPGKCFRPGLHLAVGEMFGLPRDLLHSSAIALELIHAASLVHDDLPALDNDYLRRGRETCHVRFGPAVAVLTGDRMIALALEIVAENEQLDPEARAGLVRLLSGAVVELCDGQLLDLQSSGGVPDSLDSAPVALDQAQVLDLRHTKKTGALISAAVVGPLLMLGRADRNEAEPHLRAYARHLGLLFQITDDILDATSTKEQLGKEVGGDARRSTPTYISVHGFETAHELAQQTADKAVGALQPFGVSAELLAWLVGYVLKRSK